MTERNVLSMIPIKEKLRNLKDIFPGQEDDFYQFANYLAVMLNDQLVPAGFYIRMELSISDCMGVLMVMEDPLAETLSVEMISLILHGKRLS